MSSQKQVGTEPTKRRCPYCQKAVESRGLYAHVMNSRDDAHGNYRSVPEGFNPREAEIVSGEDSGAEEIKAPNLLYLCTLCGGLYRGEMGYKVHLAKVAGDDVHPREVDIVDGHYVEIPADEDWMPAISEEALREIERQELVEDDAEQQTLSQSAGGKVPLDVLEELASRFEGQGDAYETACVEVEEIIARYS